MLWIMMVESMSDSWWSSWWVKYVRCKSVSFLQGWDQCDPMCVVKPNYDFISNTTLQHHYTFAYEVWNGFNIVSVFLCGVGARTMRRRRSCRASAHVTRETFAFCLALENNLMGFHLISVDLRIHEFGCQIICCCECMVAWIRWACYFLGRLQLMPTIPLQLL